MENAASLVESVLGSASSTLSTELALDLRKPESKC